MAETPTSVPPPPLRDASPPRPETPAAAPATAPVRPGRPRRRGRRPRRPLLAAGALLMLAAAAAGLLLTSGGGPREPVTVEEVVQAYLAARHEGDGEKACGQLSEGQAMELAARVSEVVMSSASAEDCPTYVLRTSPNSQYTRSNLSAFDEHGLDVEIEGDYASVRPVGLRWPVLAAWRRDGRWQLDGAANLGASFLAGCTSKGSTAAYCHCVFDTVRARYPRKPHLEHSVVHDWLVEVFTKETEVLGESIEACQAAGGGPGSGARPS